MVLYEGFDPEGIKRVYGEGRTAPEAETECHNAALDHVRKRPDTGPLSDWTFRPVPPNLVA
jgi:hypothetical protein